MLGLDELMLKNILQLCINKVELQSLVTPDEVLDIIKKVKADPNVEITHEKITAAQVQEIIAIVCDIATILANDICPIVNVGLKK